MLFKPLLAAIAALVVLAGPALAYDADTWERDVELVERSVIEALDAQFLETRRRENWEDYHQAFVAALERVNGIVDPQTMVILRHIAFALESDFREIGGRRRWQQASFYIRTKLDLTTVALSTTQQ